MNENHLLQHLYNNDSGFYAPNVVLQAFPYTSILLFSSFYLLINLLNLKKIPILIDSFTGVVLVFSM